jgi:solute carrier family 35 protein C2
VQVMMASMMGGLRWVLCQIVLHKADLGLTHPIDTVYHVAPCMGVAVLPFALYFEGASFVRSPLLFQVSAVCACFPFKPGSLNTKMNMKATFGVALQTLLAVSFGGLLAFGLNANEYFLVHATSGFVVFFHEKFFFFKLTHHQLCSVTMMVAGLFKEILTLSVACLFGHESLTLLNVLGLLLSMTGIVYYNFLKYQCGHSL